MPVGPFCPMTHGNPARDQYVIKSERRSPRFSTQISTIRGPVGAEGVEPFDGFRPRRTERHEGSFGCNTRSSSCCHGASAPGRPGLSGFALSLRIFMSSLTAPQNETRRVYDAHREAGIDYPGDPKTEVRNSVSGEAERSPTYPSCMLVTSF